MVIFLERFEIEMKCRKFCVSKDAAGGGGKTPDVPVYPASTFLL